MYYVGIDWADDHHDIHITDDSSKKLESFRIAHNPEGFDSFLSRIQNLSLDKNKFLFALETSKGLLIASLLKEGYTVYPINPMSVARYRERYKTSGVKTDQFDAMVLANILRTDRGQYRPLGPDTPFIKELKILTRDHQQLIDDRTRLSNKLTACLKEYYPLALKLFSSVTQKITLQFLKSYPTPQQAQTFTRARLQQFLKKNAYSHPKRLEDLLKLIKSPWLKAEPLVVKSKSRLMLTLVGQLNVLQVSIEQYEEEIGHLFDAHQDKDIYTSLPGCGKNLGPRLLAEIGDDRKRYKNSNSIQCEAGTAPVTKRSGNYIHVHFRRACRKPLRNALQEFSFCSINWCEWARQYYDSQRVKGKKHHEAVRALANKWVKIIFVMWQNRVPYNEAYHLQMKTEHAPQQKLLQPVACTL